MNTLIEEMNQMGLSRNGKPVRIRIGSRSRPWNLGWQFFCNICGFV